MDESPAAPAKKRSRKAGQLFTERQDMLQNFNLSGKTHFLLLLRGTVIQFIVFTVKHTAVSLLFSCSHQGIGNVKRHQESTTHINCKNASALRSTCSLTNMGFVPVGSATDLQVSTLYYIMK